MSTATTSPSPMSSATVVSAPRHATRRSRTLERRAISESFVRADGRVGTRNSLDIVGSMNCPATVAHAIARHSVRVGFGVFPNVDGVAEIFAEPLRVASGKRHGEAPARRAK